MGWWQDFFKEEFSAVLMLRDDATILQICQEIISLTGLKPGDRVYDQCCGIGQLTGGFVAAGMEVIGIDQSASYIERAQAARMSNAEFICGDATEYIAQLPCHAAVNWYTSFAYSDDPEQHVRMASAAFHSLLPGGYYAIETYHLAYVLTHFKEKIWQKLPHGSLLKTSYTDQSRNMMCSDWEFTSDAGVKHFGRGETFMYMPEDYRTLLMRVGFTDVVYYADASGAALGQDSPRLVVLARKPGLE